MEEFKEMIAQAVEEGVRNALEKAQIVASDKDPDELLTVEQIHEEYGIGVNTVRKIFATEDLPVQRYTTPYKVTRRAFNQYMNKSHDYLKGDE